jgi:tetratricopeptide (TPR) repeat protein
MSELAEVRARIQTALNRGQPEEVLSLLSRVSLPGPEALAMEAHARMQLNQFKEAARIWGRLTRDPNASDVSWLHWARCLLAARETDKAREVAQQALDTHPDSERIRLLMFQVLVAGGHRDVAVTMARRDWSLQALNTQELSLLAKLLQQSGMPDEALNVSRHLLAREGKSSALLYQHALLLQAAGRTEEALGCLQTDTDAQHAALAVSLHTGQHRLGEAESLARFWLEKKQQTHPFALLLGQILVRQERWPEGLVYLKQAVEARPDDISARLALAEAQVAARMAQEATDTIRTIPARAAGSVEVSAHLGRILAKLGRTNEAWQHLDRAAGNALLAPQALALMADLASSREQREELLRRLDEQLSQSRPSDRATLLFAKGHLYHGLASWGLAADCVDQANALVARSRPPEPAWRTVSSWIIEGNLPSRVPSGASSRVQPIFVVGLPRSGTTLVERILAGHRDVTSLGELAYWPRRLHRQQPDESSPQQLRSWAEDYLMRLASMAGKHPWVVDKQPYNFLYLPVLKALFPACRVVLCLRNTRDVWVSMYRQHFKTGNNYSFSPSALSERLNEFLHLLPAIRSHADAVVAYEDLVQAPESSVSALLRQLDLTFDASCLTPEHAPGVVDTASHAQVRRPIYRNSAGLWKNYQPYWQHHWEGLPED